MSPGLCSITFIVIKLLWLSLVSCNASLGKSFIGKLILKILCWWICLTFWVFVKSICALVVWDFSYVMVVVCCLILIIVLVVIATGEWKEHGFVVQAGRRMAYKGTNELKHTLTLAYSIFQWRRWVAFLVHPEQKEFACVYFQAKRANEWIGTPENPLLKNPLWRRKGVVVVCRLLLVSSVEFWKQ